VQKKIPILETITKRSPKKNLKFINQEEKEDDSRENKKKKTPKKISIFFPFKNNI